DGKIAIRLGTGRRRHAGRRCRRQRSGVATGGPGRDRRGDRGRWRVCGPGVVDPHGPASGRRIRRRAGGRWRGSPVLAARPRAARRGPGAWAGRVTGGRAPARAGTWPARSPACCGALTRIAAAGGTAATGTPAAGAVATAWVMAAWAGWGMAAWARIAARGPKA